DVRFWEDEQPDLGFYLNGAAQYEFNTNQTPGFGQDWPVMDLGRGLYTGYDYINQLPETYFNDYINKVKSYVEGRNGNITRPITNIARPSLALSAVGHDLRDVAGYDFIDKMSRDYSAVGLQGINGLSWTLLAMETGNYDFYEKEEYPDQVTK